MGRELKRVAPGADWQRPGMDTPLMDEDPPYAPGTWYQMWQTVSDKPYTPAFESAEELARWCADHPFGTEVNSPVTYEAWLDFINGPGWAISMIGSPGTTPGGV